MIKRILFLSVLLPLSCLSSQWALVKSPVAVIYSWPDLTAPIGFVRSGKKLLVGEVARNRGRVLPTVVSGKIAWVKKDDIILFNKKDYNLNNEGRLVHREREFLPSRFTGPDDRLSYVSVEFGYFDLGSQYQDTLNANNGSDGATYVPQTTIGFKVHPKREKRINFLLGFGFLWDSQSNVKLQSYHLVGKLLVSLYQSYHFLFELGAGLMYLPRIEAEISGTKSDLTALGQTLTLQGTYFFLKKYGILAQLGYQAIETSSDEANPVIDDDFSGALFVLGILHRF